MQRGRRWTSAQVSPGRSVPAPTPRRRRLGGGLVHQVIAKTGGGDSNFFNGQSTETLMCQGLLEVGGERAAADALLMDQFMTEELVNPKGRSRKAQLASLSMFKAGP